MGGCAREPFFTVGEYLTRKRPQEEEEISRARKKAISKADVDWFIWRIVITPDIPAGLAEIRGTWSLIDVVDAHKIADMHDDLRKIAKREAERKKA